MSMKTLLLVFIGMMLAFLAESCEGDLVIQKALTPLTYPCL